MGFRHLFSPDADLEEMFAGVVLFPGEYMDREHEHCVIPLFWIF